MFGGFVQTYEQCIFWYVNDIFLINLITFILGKTCENVRKYKNILIEQDPEKALKKISKFNFVYCKQIGNLLVFDMKKEEVTLDKPRYIGSDKYKKYIFHMISSRSNCVEFGKGDNV